MGGKSEEEAIAAVTKDQPGQSAVSEAKPVDQPASQPEAGGKPDEQAAAPNDEPKSDESKQKTGASEKKPDEGQQAADQSATDQSPAKQVTSEPAASPQEPELPPQTYVVPQPPQGASERVKQIEQELKDLDTQLEDADISQPDHAKQTRALQDEAQRINGEIDYAVRRFNEDAAIAEREFWSNPDNEPFAVNKALWDTLSAKVTDLRRDPETMSRGHEYVLQEAKRQSLDTFAKALGMSVPAATPTAKNDKDQPPKQPDGKQDPDKIKEAARKKVESAARPVPGSLSDFPGTPGAAETQFEALSKKPPIDMFDALMELPKEQQTEWLNRRV